MHAQVINCFKWLQVLCGSAYGPAAGLLSPLRPPATQGDHAETLTCQAYVPSKPPHRHTHTQGGPTLPPDSPSRPSLGPQILEDSLFKCLKKYMLVTQMARTAAPTTSSLLKITQDPKGLS